MESLINGYFLQSKDSELPNIVDFEAQKARGSIVHGIRAICQCGQFLSGVFGLEFGRMRKELGSGARNPGKPGVTILESGT